MAHSSRIGATWRDTTQPSVRHGGSWRTVSDAWIRKAGAWEQWWPDGPDRLGPYIFGNIAAYNHITRWNGSAWEALSGGVSATIGRASRNDINDIFCFVGTGGRFWNGTSWATYTPTGFDTTGQALTTDGSLFYAARRTLGADPAKIWSLTPPSSAGILLYLYTTDPSSEASVDDLAYGTYGGYVAGTFDDPYSSPVSFTSGGSSPASMIGTRAMARQGDGKVWTGCLSGGQIAVENGALDSWTTVGGTVTGGNVNAICALPDSTAYAAGTFTAIGAVSCAGIAYWNGTAWSQPFTLSNIVGMSYHRGLLWILSGTTNRKVYSWNGTTLTENSDWTGSTISGIL